MVGLERGTVELTEYDPAWREAYRVEIDRLEAIAGGRFLGYEHVGSTAIEGMPAKPVVDLIALVDDLDEARSVIPVLEDHGYESRPGDDVRGRLFLARGPPSNRTHYLSIAERGGRFLLENVTFRDYLRDHPDVAEEYAALKREAAAEHPDDRDPYTEAKAPFVEAILERAMYSDPG